MAITDTFLKGDHNKEREKVNMYIKLEKTMQDNRTANQKYQAWINAVNKAWIKGWKHSQGWIFISPSKTLHDLSAADLDKLDEIERDQLFSL